MRRRIYIVAFALAMALFINCFFAVFALGDNSLWTDDGNFDADWLGDYDTKTEYEISNELHLAAFLSASMSGKTFEGKTLRLVSDIDMSAHLWIPAFSEETPFKGVFDGNGHFISNIVFNNGIDSAAFLANNSGTVLNLQLHILAFSQRCASIAFINNGNIYNCAVSGEIGTENSLEAGGISYINTGSITNCYNVALINISIDVPDTKCGGISVINSGSITHCGWFNADHVTSEDVLFDSCFYITDKAFLLSSLNDIASQKDWCSWAEADNPLFYGYPCLVEKLQTPDPEPIIPVSSITLSVREVEMRPGSSLELTYNVYPSDATDKTVEWESTNGNVAKVDENGVIHAYSKGYAIIRAKSADGNVFTNCYIYVNAEPSVVLSQSIHLESTEYKLVMNSNLQIRYSIAPSNVSNKNVYYEVSDETVVVCDSNGVLSPVSPGFAVLTVKSVDGSSSVSALVSVIEDTYSELWGGEAASKFAGGDGSLNNPYIISNGAQLAKLAHDVNSGITYEGKYFVQSSSILLNDTSKKDWMEKKNVNVWTPIGESSEHSFKGNYNGNGFSIAGLYISSDSSYNGLFGYTCFGTLSKINLKHAVIKGGDYCAGIAGYSASFITDCKVWESCEISGFDNVGAIAGYSIGRIDFCKNYAKVSAKKNVGGIVGISDNIILNSGNYSSVKGTECVGGIAGSSSFVIENCFNNSIVTAEKRCGGIAGETSMGIYNCYCVVMPMATELFGTIAGFADVMPHSYVPMEYKACGNLENSDEYLIYELINGSFALVKNDRLLVDELNKLNGCVYGKSYYGWIVSEGNGETFSDHFKALSSVTDESTGMIISGASVGNSSDYVFTDISELGTKTALSKINSSKLFDQYVILPSDILFSKKLEAVGFSDAIDLGYLVSLPFDVSKVSEKFPNLTDSKLLEQVVFVNIASSKMTVYKISSASCVESGEYVGILKCRSFNINGGTVTEYKNSKKNVNFTYADGIVSFFADYTGEWLVLRYGESKAPVVEDTVVDIDTQTEQPIVEEDRVYTFSTVMTVVVCVLLVFGSVAVILIQRSKNNLIVKNDYDDM